MDKPSASTPMLRQYQEIKASHKDCILFFRLGDFYEMFYEDARAASQILELVLTSRGSDGQGRIPMCGVPYHSADNYIAKLVRAGKKVAICEQVEDPALAKGLVRREVIRVITAGTFVDESSEARSIVALRLDKKTIALAFTDTASGTVRANQVPSLHQALELLAKTQVHECLFPDGQEEEVRKVLAHPMLRLREVTLTPFRDWSFAPDRGRQVLLEHFGTLNLRGFGLDELSSAQACAGALIEYLRETNKTPLKHIDRLTLYDDTDHVFISPPAHYGLELEAMVKALDRTRTAMGRRMFRSWLYHPLKDVERIRERQKAVGILREDAVCRQALEDVLALVPDVEKSLSRLSCGTGAARDLLAVRNALLCAPRLREALARLSASSVLFSVGDVAALRELLERAVNPEMPLTKNEGKVIRSGYHAEIDELRTLRAQGTAWLADYQAREVRRTGISSLKVSFNRVFGYYIEVTNANLKAVPPEYQRKQTLVNGERFITPELKEYEQKILTAEDRILRLEAAVVGELIGKVLADMSQVHALAREMATVDVLQSLGAVAALPQWVRPEVTEGTELFIDAGRHPVVEGVIGSDFIPNDTRMDGEENRLMVLTGPNMSGKSTYIRQNALLVILAQMGSFVPAALARIGAVDKIFTRIGAHDEILKGQSTFMVEMTEAADILNNLTSRSLVVLDEVGRGTSTYDGLSLAWAIAEFLQEKKTRTFFATHFHELTLLADRLKGVKNYNVLVREWEGKVVFMHKIVPGGTDDSYGIHVAQLAGIPAKVLRRAQAFLSDLEAGGSLKDRLKGAIPSQEESDLFGRGLATPVADEVRATLEALDVNNLTPLQALQKLEELKAGLRQ
ncbi:MAG: DNA mismatch repair protein MutS [Elusimicrobia bacterium]|nr:DNA mismatch repair protein MutS [Elusimicrobiota bacterium]